ncbi:unnamed protein product [Cuscuta europaea]|uniref:Trichome birefringence-like N-terminal domain-containing protein n=1 Tax=Cuscuta europaea TaxID=41803 RepID=A0A9P1DY34_CUSEU|nr:unnamed protein product [Cuscuta europaea]
MGPLLDFLGHFLLLLTLVLQVWSYHPYAEMVSSISHTACNRYEGKWVSDNEYPLFSSSDYFFVPPNRKCADRKDTNYLHYRWQPNNCELAKFDAKNFVKTYKGKMVMFVGDSIAQNQWMSMASLIQNAYGPESIWISTTNPPIFSLYFKQYDLTLAFEQNRYLALLEGQVLKLDNISSNSIAWWQNASLLVFNCYHWFTHPKLEWASVEVNGTIDTEMEPMGVFTKALQHWGEVVDNEIDPTKTRVFFQGITAVHPDCNKYRMPINESSLASQMNPYTTGEEIIEYELSQMKSEVTFLNITLLTRLRPDSHPELMEKGVRDCSHWCVAGVPDTWNQLMYAELFPN